MIVIPKQSVVLRGSLFATNRPITTKTTQDQRDVMHELFDAAMLFSYDFQHR